MENLTDFKIMPGDYSGKVVIRSEEKTGKIDYDFLIEYDGQIVKSKKPQDNENVLILLNERRDLKRDCLDFPIISKLQITAIGKLVKAFIDAGLYGLIKDGFIRYDTLSTCTRENPAIDVGWLFRKYIIDYNPNTGRAKKIQYQ